VIATKRSLPKASIDPGFTSLLDHEDLEIMSTDQERISDGCVLNVDSSRTLTVQENAISTTPLSGKELIFERSSRLVAKNQLTGIIKRPLRWKGRLVKELCNFWYER
jgi:hypothetical protein